MDLQAAVPHILSGFRRASLKPAQDFSEFLFGSEYLSLPEGEIYPGVVRLGGEIYDGFLNNLYDAAIITAGLGSGKSTLAELMACAVAHWLVCLPDPHEYFGLLPDKPIVLPVMGPTAEQVKRVVFTGIRSFIGGSPFFQRLEPKPKAEVRVGDTSHDVLKLSISFSRFFVGEEREIVSILAGNSTETYPVGMNVLFAIVDEISKFRDDTNRSQAKQIFETLDQRRTSRFADAPIGGMTLCIGTAGAKDDYVDRKMAEAGRDPQVFTHRAKTWEMKGREQYKGPTFHLVKRDLGYRGIKYDCLDGPPPEGEGKTLLHLPDIPGSFRRVFERDPVLALRDFASIPSHALNPFDANAEMIHKLANLDREHPLIPGTRKFQDWFVGEPGVEYYVHIDLALNRETGDAAGLGVGHLLGAKEVLVAGGEESKIVREARPVISLDLMMRWEAPPGGEIRFSEIRQFLYGLRERGFNINGRALEWDKWGNPRPDKIIGGVSYDGWQSVDSIQILKEQGISAFVFSVDRTSGPYEDLKEAIQDRRLDFYRLEAALPNGEVVLILEHEYVALEAEYLSGGRVRIDHPEGGSKDVADAAAGVASRITRDFNRPQGGFV